MYGLSESYFMYSAQRPEAATALFRGHSRGLRLQPRLTANVPLYQEIKGCLGTMEHFRGHSFFCKVHALII
jgi:hypothetical protein